MVRVTRTDPDRAICPTAIRRTAPTAITTTPLTPAHPMAITARAGSRAVSSLALVPGMAGAIVAGVGATAAGPGVMAATMADVPASELAIAAVTPVATVADTLAARVAIPVAEPVASLAAVVHTSLAEAVASTVVVAATAADTAKSIDVAETATHRVAVLLFSSSQPLELQQQHRDNDPSHQHAGHKR